MLLLAGRGITPPLAFAESDLGRLLIVAFRDGAPAGDIEISGTFGRFKTKPTGILSLDLPEGSYKALVPSLNKTLEFKIVADEETELTLQILEPKGVAKLSTPPTPTSAATSGPKKHLHVLLETQSDKRPIAKATILIAGEDHTFATDEHGRADIEISGDNKSITIFHEKFKSETRSLNDNATDLNIRMKPAQNDLEDVVVLAPKMKGSVAALIEVRRQSSAVTDVLGTEQMARAGDSDAASSLRRVTGLTLMNGKYVYVRGLGERYSSVRMNGFSMPSPEPARRVVPLDLFPTAVLESIVVQKSYSPDQPGEFGGGVIQLKTKSVPEKAFFKASLQMNLENPSGQETSRGGSTDWLGVDDGTRRLPSAIRSAISSGQKLIVRQPGSSEGLTAEELQELGRSLPNNYATKASEKQTPPGFTMAGGSRYHLGAIKLGYSASLLYGQSADAGDKLNKGYNVGSGGALVPDFSENAKYSEVETRLAGGVDLGLEWRKSQSVGFGVLALRNTSDFIQHKNNQTAATPNSTIESTTLEWTERQLLTYNLKGHHDLDGAIGWPVEVEWRAGLAEAKRYSPDRRNYTYERTPTSYQMRSDSGGNLRTDSDLSDDSKELGLDLKIPILREDNLLTFKGGVLANTRVRESETYRFFFQRDFAGSSSIDLGAPPEEQFQKDNIRPGGFVLQNLTDSADSYRGEQQIFATYALFDINPLPTWQLQAGMRFESSKQTVKTFKYFEKDQPFAQSDLNMKDRLPAYSVTWKPDDHWRTRLAYSETLARPDFRELSTTGFIDDETGYEVQGNENLKGTVIKNFDQRTEYYFSSDEFVSLGAFYKRFLNPIEVMFVPGVNKIQTFDNARAADNFGVETEARFGLRRVSRFLRRWSIAGNYTYIQSKIQLDDRNRGIQTSDKRPLQGQSPYSANFQIEYERPLIGLTGALVYNVIGPRITEVGTNQVPDTYEQSFHQVDFVLAKSIAKNMTVAFKAKNLLDPLVEARQGNEIVRQYRRGRTAGVSLNAIF